MPTLYVTEPGAVVRRRHGSLIVTIKQDHDNSESVSEKSKTILEVEPHRLELIALIGRIHITSQAVELCLKEGIAISWFSRNGNFLGRLVPELSRTADIRLKQFNLATSDEDALRIAKSIVEGKLKNSTSLLTAFRSNRPNSKAFSKAISHLNKTQSDLKTARSRDILFGLEGEAASQYYKAFGLVLLDPFKFTIRERRPPPDPVNALLSFGYVLVTNLLASLLESRGFDPYVGFLHSVRSGRPSLALDILEEFRQPVVDRFVVNLCNRKELKLGDFKSDAKMGGVRLTKSGLRTFFQKWEKYLNNPMAGTNHEFTIEQALSHQVDRLADHVREKSEYQPFLLRGDEK